MYNDFIATYFRNLLIVGINGSLKLAEHQHNLLQTLTPDTNDITDSFQEYSEDVQDAVQDYVKASKDAGLDAFWAVMGVDQSQVTEK